MSAPPIRIESKAWTDSRYAALALRLGLPRAEFALVLVATIWRWQTEHYTDDQPTYSVPRAVVEGALGSLQGPEALVAADLAELEPDGRLRIKGGRDDAGKSRIDWLHRDREERRAAGRASAARRKAAGDPRGERGKFADLAGAQPTDDQRPTNGPPTEPERDTERPPSSLVSGLRTPEDLFLSPGARGPATAAPAPEAKPHGSAVRLVALAVELLNAARLGIDPKAQPVDADQGDEMAAAGHLRGIPEDRREVAIRHGVAAIAASVKAGKDTIAALRPGELFGPRSWRKWQAAPTEFTPRGRDGPGGSRQATPATSHGTGIIDGAF